MGFRRGLAHWAYYKSSAPSTAEGGWRIERASTGDDAIALNMVGAGGEYSSNVPMNDNEWHHLVTTFGGGNKKIYVDGVQVASATQTGSVTASALPLIFGDPVAKTDDRTKIDDVRIYSTVLSAADVAAIYNNGAGDIGQPKFAITSPATVSGSAGRSISYQIVVDPAYGMTGYNSTITYELLNAPSWLSVGSSSGTVTGTPPSSGTYTFEVKGSNTLGSAVKEVTLNVYSYGDWNYALSFTTDYSGGTPLTDWNMLFRLSEDSSTGAGTAGFRYSQANANGGDLRFVYKAGEELKYEIANWNTSGESQVWVRVPSLASDENVTMYWGNTNAGLPAYANNGSTWDGYFGVYHLEGTTGSAVDSSPMSNNLPGVNAPVLEASGLSGTAYSSTSAANNGFISSALSGNIKAKNGTYSLWINHSPNVANKHFFGMEYNNDASNYLYVVGGTASANKARVWVAGGSTGFAGISTPTTTLSGGWQMLTLVINNGYAQVYVDGTADGSSAWYHPGLDTVSGLAIGRGTAGAGTDSTFDEATFSTIPRTADWLSASYNNQKPSSTYLNFGNLVGPISLNDPDNTKIFGKKDTTITSYTVAHSGSGSFSASGLPPGLSINAATGIISGSTSVTGSQNVTVTATGTTAGGGSVTVTKVYNIQISDPASFPFRMDLTLSGYTGSSTLTDFPVLVSLSSSITGFSYNGFLDSDGDGVRTGGDLRFFATSGQELAYEIVDWNTSGNSDIWVKVPSISGTNTVITAAWGKTGTETTPDYSTDDPVWSNDFGGVWHFSTTSTNFPDSSPNGNHASRNSVGVTNSGKVGQAASFTGTEFADASHSDSINTDKFTLSIWVKRSSGTGYATPFSARGTNDGTRGYLLYSQNNKFQFWTGKGIPSSYDMTPHSSTHSLNAWHHVAATYDGTTKKIWLNGVGGGTSNANPNYLKNTLYGLRFGAGANENPTGQYFWVGELDEMRHSSINRSADWIKAEYDNQKTTQSLISYGSITGPRMITSDLTASGTYNTAFTYTITASDPSNISSRVPYGLPEGLVQGCQHRCHQRNPIGCG